MLIDFSYLKVKYNMDITGVVHVGAHYGEEIPIYINHGIQKIVCFEPLEENLRVLRNYESDNIIIFPYALGHKNYKVKMNISSNNAESSSILMPKKHLVQYPYINFNRTEEVQVKKMSYFSDKILNCNFLNMDVQGFEYQVLLGAGELINNFNYIYLEVNRDETYENNFTIESIDKLLQKYNFDRVETDWSGVIWGDAFYIKRSLL